MCLTNSPVISFPNPANRSKLTERCNESGLDVAVKAGNVYFANKSKTRSSTRGQSEQGQTYGKQNRKKKKQQQVIARHKTRLNNECRNEQHFV